METMVSHTMQESAFDLPFQEASPGRSNVCAVVGWESSKPNMENDLDVKKV